MIPLADVITKLNEKHDVVAEFFHGTGFGRRADMSSTELATLFANVVAKVLVDDDTLKRFLDEHAAFSRLFALVSPDPAATALADDAAFFSDVARAARKLAPREHQPTPEAEQAVKQFFSEGLAAGEVVNVLEVADRERPEISILSDEFLDQLGERITNQDLQVAFMRKLLSDEIRSRGRTNQAQAKIFSDQLAELLARYQNRQLSSAEVVQALVELAKKMRAARRRHEDLGLSEEEAAFYDALAGQADELSANHALADLVRELVRKIKKDLAIDWTSHENVEANIRAQVKRLLRRHRDVVPLLNENGREHGGGGGGGGSALDVVAQLVLDQARALYRYWPEVALEDTYL
jgi:type I restriction enzyme R subunit